MGLIEHFADGVEVEEGVSITYRSVMGVEIPKAKLESTMPAAGLWPDRHQFAV